MDQQTDMNEALSTTAVAAEPDERHESEGVKETIESIVVALILAFVFRAFVVEAFVIPTGSMAPTLYGAHGAILCDDCGVEFAYGLRDLDDRRKTNPVRATSAAVCPNCNHRNVNLRANDERMNPEKGDRILVLKWPFDFGGDALDPGRWDVVVFKDPSDGVTNFIKRLVGLPNEVLMILDGDVFTTPTDRLSAEAVKELERYVRDKHRFTDDPALKGRLKPLQANVIRELERKLTVTPKNKESQKALWAVVYDHDYPPRTLDANQPRWTPGRKKQSGWDARSRHIVFKKVPQRSSLRSPGEDPPDYIELNGTRIRATNAYNVHDGRHPPLVTDLRVRFVWTPREPDATVHVRLIKQGRTFWATFRADGVVALSESKHAPSDLKSSMAMEQLDPFTIGRAVALSFEHVDYRLAVHVAGKEILKSSTDPDSHAFYVPDVSALRSQALRKSGSRAASASKKASGPPRLYGEAGDFEATHLVVERDVHYYHNDRFFGLGGNPWAPSSGWGSAISPIFLRHDEFFMLGDNTAASKDSRLWDTPGEHLKRRGEAFQLGTVPRDQLIGKAFFVYWPSGYRLSWLPIPLLNKLGIIPDVGRMRWIR